MQPPRLAELKTTLRALESAPLSPLPTGWATVDALLGGGFPTGCLVEIAGTRSSGKTTLALSTLAQSPTFTACVDPHREIYPPSVASLGVDLGRLLWVSPPPTAMGVLRAGEILARSRVFALVLLDFPDGQRVPHSIATRLRLLAHQTGTTLLLLTTTASALPHAAVRLGAARDIGARCVTVTLHKGGAAPPGATARMGLPTTSDFRPPEQAARLHKALEFLP